MRGFRYRHVAACLPLFILTALSATKGGVPGKRPTVAQTLDQSAQTDAFDLIGERIDAGRDSFFIYRDGDSGLNHGIPSGFFGAHERIRADAFCIDDPNSPTGCSSDPNAQDTERVNVFMVRFLSLEGSEVNFAGINFQEPESEPTQGEGYNLTGATELRFDARSPNPANFSVRFGVDGLTGPFMELTPEWRTYVLTFSDLGLTSGDLRRVNILFTIVTDVRNAPSGGIVLLDNIEVRPAPFSRAVLSLPVSLQTHGVVPALNAAREEPIPPDQLNRNAARVEDVALAILALLDRGHAPDRERATHLAGSLLFALNNDNQGSPVPSFTPAEGPSAHGFHTAYSSGHLPFINDQPGGAERGDVRLAGFTGGTACGPTGYCILGDDADLRTNALVGIALLAAYRELARPDCLDAARGIAAWANALLLDPSQTGFGGYLGGFRGLAGDHERLEGKPTDGNAALFAFLTDLAGEERRLGRLEAASELQGAAARSAEFVLSMFDASSGCFNVGTLPTGSPEGAGLEPRGPTRGGDVINTFRNAEATSFAMLALASAPVYRDRIDWSRAAQCLRERFSLQVNVAGTSFSGVMLTNPTPVQRYPDGSPPGVVWGVTAQAALVFRLAAVVSGDARLKEQSRTYLTALEHARQFAPFGDGRGLPEATLGGGDSLPPALQCFSAPFFCIPERVGLGATTWGLLAARHRNPLGLGAEFSFPFFQGDASSFTGFAVSNNSFSSALLEFDAIGSDGRSLGLPGNPFRLLLESGAQLARLGRDMFGSPPPPAEDAWLRVLSDNPGVAGFFQFGRFDLSRLDGANAVFGTSREILLTRVFHGPAALMGEEAETTVQVVNPNADPITARLTLQRRDASAAPLESIVEIPPYGILARSVEDLFGDVVVSRGHLNIGVTTGKGAVAFESIRVNGKAFLGLNAVGPDCGPMSYSAQFATSGDIFTSLNLVNAGSAARQTTLRIFNSDGSEFGAFELSLPPGGQFTETAAAILQIVSESPIGDFVGSLRLEADGDGVCGDVIFGDARRLEFVAALPLQAQPFFEAVFSHVANAAGFFTGLAIQNTGDAAAEANIEVVSVQGSLVGRTTLDLAPGERLSRLVSELVPASLGQAGGYVRITSSQPLVAQLLFGSIGEEGIRLFSAVPAARVR